MRTLGVFAALAFIAALGACAGPEPGAPAQAATPTRDPSQAPPPRLEVLGEGPLDDSLVAPADLIVINARVTTQHDLLPESQALAVRDGVIVRVGPDERIVGLQNAATRVIDAGGRRVIPGLNDSHLHAVRGGRFYALELRWDGVDSLARGLELIAEQAARTPEGQWVRVVGGWSPRQFAERRMPTVAELNAAAPDTPVFVLHLYSGGLLNAAGARAFGLTADTAPPPGGRYELVDGGARLVADPSPVILYQAVAKLPELSDEEQVVSTQHFFHELNRFGLTSVVDPGGGGHLWPDDYAAVRALADVDALTLRVGSYLFPQLPGREVEDLRRWTSQEHLPRATAPVWLVPDLEGAGELIVASASDYENFQAPRPALGPGMEADLEAAVRVLAAARWPLRIHATYDESIGRVLDVFERVFAETGYRERWAIDHAETLGAANLARIRALGGGVAVQDRMAFAGEDFVARYGEAAAAVAPPLRSLLDAGVPLGAGTDGTRVSSYDPWTSIAWMVTGRTVGGATLLAPEQRLTRAEALRAYTLGSAWFTGEEQLKGRLAPGQLADFAILSDDYFTVPEEQIAELRALVTVVGGRVVHAEGEFSEYAPPALPPVRPDWSPVTRFGGHARLTAERP